MHSMNLEESNSPSNDHLTVSTSLQVEDIDTHSRLPTSSTTISITADSHRSIPCSRSSKKCIGFHYVSNRKQAAAKGIPTHHLRYRLCVREFLLTRLALVSRIMSSLAIFSIIVMIILNELIFVRVGNEDTKAAWFLKVILTASTVLLLALILYYHHLDITLYTHRNRLEDWRVQLNFKKVFFIALELIICAIHPIPRSYPSIDPPKIRSNSYSMSYMPVDIALSLPMFLRLYLLGRSFMIHSPLVRNIPLRSLGYLNHVPIDAYFLIKTYLEKWPARCLLTSCIIVLLICSWAMRACDYTPTGEHMAMLDAMWLFITTATTIGYGDLYPSTYCGRSIATIIGLFGLLYGALLIGILTQKLHLTREEKYVHTFVSAARFNKDRRYQAANVIKFAVKSWCLKRQNKMKSMHYFQTQRKLFQSISSLQKIKQGERSLKDICAGFPEVINAHRIADKQVEDLTNEIANMKVEINDMKKQMYSLNDNLSTLQNTLNILIEKL